MDPPEEQEWELCRGTPCAEQAERGLARGVAARSGLCWRCHYQDKQEAVRQALERTLWAADGEGDQSEQRRLLLQRPQDPRTILQDIVRPAGVIGANAGHTAPAMRKVGLTIAKPSGHATAPLGEGEWAKRCRCPGAGDSHEHSEWLCGRCGGLTAPPVEENEEDLCIRCGQPGPGLTWCPGCQGWRHTEEREGCAGEHEAMRHRGGLCPEHSARFAHVTWGLRAKGNTQELSGEPGAPQLQRDEGSEAVPYPGVTPDARRAPEERQQQPSAPAEREAQEAGNLGAAQGTMAEQDPPGDGRDVEMAEDDEMGGSEVAVGDQAAREATSSNPRIGTTRKPGAPQAKSAPKAQPQGTETATEATTPATEQLGMCPQCYTSQE